MVYMADPPIDGTDIFVGDEGELAEMRWTSLAQAQELMNDMILRTRPQTHPSILKNLHHRTQ